MPAPKSIIEINGEVVRFKTRKFGVSVFRQRFTEHGEEKYSRPFYFSKTINKKLTRFPVGMDMKRAEIVAEEIAAFLSIPSNTLDMALVKYNPRHVARHTHYATFTQVLEAFKGALPIIGRKGGAVSASSFKGYRSFLFTMIRKVEAYRAEEEFESFMGRSHIDYSRWENQSTEILTTKFAMDFKLAAMPPPPPLETEPDEDELLSAKITADTTLRNARALFSKQALRYFKEIKLRLPDISGFMSEPDFGAKKYFQILPPEVIVGVMRASLALRVADVDAYRGYLLTMHCGLRRGEAIAFKPSWLREEDRPTLYVTAGGVFNPKHGHGRKVIVEPWVAEVLRELGPVKDASSMDKLNDWAKALIPAEHAVNKPLHELRKCWVSCKAKTDGIHAAAAQAGHKDVKVTTTHYADSQLSERLIPLWKESTDTAIKRFAA